MKILTIILLGCIPGLFGNFSLDNLLETLSLSMVFLTYCLFLGHIGYFGISILKKSVDHQNENPTILDIENTHFYYQKNNRLNELVNYSFLSALGTVLFILVSVLFF